MDQLISSLGFRALCRLVADLLRALGYTDVRLADRGGGRTEVFGRNRDGGWDLDAGVPGGALGQRRALVQVKRYAQGRSVHRRQCDELRGACLRRGAAEGLIVTTGTFSAPAVESAQEQARLPGWGAPLIAPLHLIDGDALVEMLIAHGVGVKRSVVVPVGGTPMLRCDRGYFAALETLRPSSVVADLRRR